MIDRAGEGIRVGADKEFDTPMTNARRDQFEVSNRFGCRCALRKVVISFSCDGGRMLSEAVN